MDKETTEKKSYFYRTRVDSNTGKSIGLLMAKSEETFNAASKLAYELGASGFDTSKGAVLSGIGVLFFDKKPSSRRFKVIAKNAMGYAAIPNHEKEAGRKVMTRIAQLPMIPVEELKKVFNLTWDTTAKEQDIPMPRFFRVEKEWDYITYEQPLDLPDIEELDEMEFEKAWAYVKSES